RRCRRWLVPCCDRKGSSASTHIYFAWVLLCSATMILPKYQPHMTREAEYDLAIVGGGPAGSAAAIVAARGGMRVLLLERGSFPRHKVCGEFVSSESLALLRDLLQGNDVVLANAVAIERFRVHVGSQTLE